MSDELLAFYEKELAFLRQSGAEFARAHPKIASRLRISDDIVEDPHVSRLLEGVAYLNARIQKKLSDDFPELSDALLDNLYPHYTKPIPSMAVVSFKPKEDLDATLKVAKGVSLETDPVKGKPCTFQTTAEMTLVPANIVAAKYQGKPFATPGSKHAKEADAVLHVRLKTFVPEVTFASLGLSSLRFYLCGQPQHAYPLHEALLNQCKLVAVSSGKGDALILPPHKMKAVGFEENEGALPYPPDSFPGYRLLTEFMVFPEKFLFVEIADIQNALAADSDTLDLYFYVANHNPELERHVNADHLALNCVPIVNLFKHRAEPILLEHQQTSYEVISDSRFALHYEVYSVDAVRGVKGDGTKVDYRPYYGLNHSDVQRNTMLYWNAQRHETLTGELGNEVGTRVDLTLLDLNHEPGRYDDETLSVETMCFNANMPEKLPFGGGLPHFKCGAIGIAMDAIDTLTRITGTCRPPMRNGARWRLVSHLTLNHLSLEGPNATRYLREILTLYDFMDSTASRTMINAIQHIDTRAMTAPVTWKGKTTLCRGTEIELTFDESLLVGNSVFLFAQILERFFSMYCSVNSFTRLVVRLKGRREIFKKWPPRAGDQVLI